MANKRHPNCDKLVGHLEDVVSALENQNARLQNKLDHSKVLLHALCDEYAEDTDAVRESRVFMARQAGFGAVAE